jgi:hypothetical protein
MDVEIVLIYCAHCGMPFGITRDRMNRLKYCHNTFWCPSGHGQIFAGKSEEERLKEKVEYAEKQMEWQRKKIKELSKNQKLPRKPVKRAKK